MVLGDIGVEWIQGVQGQGSRKGDAYGDGNVKVDMSQQTL